MSNSEEVVRRFLDEVISQGKADVLAEVMDPDLIWHGGSFGEEVVPGLVELEVAVPRSTPALR